MDPVALKSLKEFLAAEWGVRLEDITDKEVLNHHRSRRRRILVGVSIALLVYVSCRVLWKRVIADWFFLLIVLVVGVLSVVRLRSRRELSPGRLMRIKESMVERFGVKAEDITNEQALSYDRAEWKGLLMGVSFLCLVYVAYSLLWRSLLVDLLVLLMVLSVGYLSVSGLWSHTHK